MPPRGISAQGTVISRSADPFWPDKTPLLAPINFIEIAELRNTTPPNLTRNALETTTHNEDDDAYIVGIRRHGDLTFQVNFVPDNPTHNGSTGLQKAWHEGTRDIYQVMYPDGSYWLFSGFVTGFNITANVDEVLVADVTVRPTGGHIFVEV